MFKRYFAIDILLLWSIDGPDGDSSPATSTSLPSLRETGEVKKTSPTALRFPRK